MAPLHYCSMKCGGLIKLLPNVISPMSIGKWRPILLMGGLYNMFAKVVANQLQKVLSSII